MEIKRFYKKDENDNLIMTNGNVIIDYKIKKRALDQIEKVKATMESLGLSDKVKEINDIDIGLSADDEPEVESIIARRLSKNQNFTQKFIDQAIKGGYASMSKGKFILHTQEGDLNYKIIRSPGYYCCHDNKSLGGEKECRKYVEANFKDIKSPDENNPSGYRKDNFHACELEGEI